MSDGGVRDLLSVQDLDLAADQLRHRRSHLPERAELAEIDARALSAGAELEALDSTLRELGDRQTATERDLAATEERSATVNRRLFGGEVTASRDLQAMSAELEQLRGRASMLEDAVLEIMEEREPLDSRAAELRQMLDALAADRLEAEGRRRAAERDIDAEVAQLEVERASAAEEVAEKLLATYERLRARLGGVGVARLVGNHCDGCHLTLSAMELDRVRHLPEGEVYQCEQCSRILVP